MATPTETEFDSALQHSLCRLGVATITPKPEQRKAVQSIYQGRDVFVWLPTGFGKSLCYEVLPFVMDHKLGRVGSAASLVLIVSPLIALMTDQVSSLRKRGVKAAVMRLSMTSPTTHTWGYVGRWVGICKI